MGPCKFREYGESVPMNLCKLLRLAEIRRDDLFETKSTPCWDEGLLRPGLVWLPFDSWRSKVQV